MIETPFLKAIVIHIMATMSLVGCANQVRSDTSDRIDVGGNSAADSEKVPEGYVDLEFVVNEQGAVVQPVVLESTDPLFEPAAVKAVLKFKYEPRIVDGQPVAVPGVTTRIRFVPVDETEQVEQK